MSSAEHIAAEKVLAGYRWLFRKVGSVVDRAFLLACRRLGQVVDIDGISVRTLMTDGVLAARISSALELAAGTPYARLISGSLQEIQEGSPYFRPLLIGPPWRLYVSPEDWRAHRYFWAVGLTWFAAWARAVQRGSKEPWRNAQRWAYRAGWELDSTDEEWQESRALRRALWTDTPYPPDDD